MENRRSHVLVGAVTLLLVLALFAFVLWLSRVSGEARKEYDIFFKQSVAGLAVGSAVSFSGVPVGQVRQIALMPDSPEFVRVRIEVSPDVPVLAGTTASLQGVGFTGVTEIQLEGATRGAPAIEEPGPFGAPVIPARPSGFGQLLESAPEVLERASTLLARLNEVFDDENRAALATTLTNLDRATGTLADQGPAIGATLAQAQDALKAATRAAGELEKAGASADRLLTEGGKPLMVDLRAAVASANGTIQRIDRLAASAEPGLQTLATETVPQVNRLVIELRDVTQQLGALSARLDEDPLGAVTGGRQLPDYDPEARPETAP